jgi:carboxyl-terminal processing protease
MSAKIRIAIVMLSAGVAFYAIAGGFPWDRGATAKGNQWAQLRIFDEVLYHISKDYVDEPDMERVRTGALRGLADGLDPYSAYLTPNQVASYKPVEPGMREVGGMALSKYSGYLYVVSVTKKSAAERSGIWSGDVIEYIGKAPTRDMSLYDAEMLLTDANAPNDLRVFRQGQSIKLSYTAGPSAVPSVEVKTLDGGVGYVGVPGLTQGKAAEVKAAVEGLAAKGVKKIVLDLRGAATGSIDEGVAVANLFVESGVLARKVGKGGVDAQTYQAQPSAAIYKGPLSVVVDTGTAGAGEVVAAAILANKRGEVVGERTFGAGVELDLFKLRDGGAMLITVAKYAPATGKPFIEEGVTPSVEVKQQTAEIAVPEETTAEEEEAAEAADGTPKDDAKVVKPTPKPAPAEDLQLKKALELLNGGAAAAKAKAA